MALRPARPTSWTRRSRRSSVRFVRERRLDHERAVEAVEDLLALRLRRYAQHPFLLRAFDLRDNVTVYDALYLTLAEALNATLLTRDARLATVPGCAARVQVVR